MLQAVTAFKYAPMGELADPCGLGPHAYSVRVRVSVGASRGDYMYKCECGREFSTTSSYAGHCSHCATHLGHEPEDHFGDSRAWSRGKTKDTDERVARAAAQKRERIANGDLCKPFAGMKHSEETKRKMSISAHRVAKEGRNGWKCGDSHIQNRYELITD